MTIDDFRKNSELVKASRELLANQHLQLMLQVLLENGPQHRVQPIGLSPTDAATRLGHICGYAEYPTNFQLLGTYAKAVDQIEATYEEPTAEEESES